MTILHIITLSEIGGAQSVVIELANRATLEGHTVAVLSRPNGRMWELLDRRVLRFRTRTFRRAINPISDLLACLVVAKTYWRIRPDIVHLHSSKAGVWGRLALFFRKSRIVYTIHGFDTILKANASFLPLEKMLARAGGAIVAVSEYDRINLNKHGILVRAMIHNGVRDLSEAEYLDLPQVSGDGSKARVCTLARLAAPKRFDLFLEAALLLADKDVRFYWIGNSNLVEGLPSMVRCLGELPNARQYLKNFDIFFLPSDYEGMPMSIVEALSAGLPVVASDVGGVREALDGSNGIAVKNEANLMALAIESILASPKESSAQGNLARKRYEEGFAADRMWKEYLTLYDAMRVMKA